MGVIYKLKEEIKDFIIEKKRVDPNLSCRKLSTLILDKFQIKISKSSINSIIKNTGLSSPVGRRRKRRRRQPQTLIKPQQEIKLLAPLVETPVEKPAEVLVEQPIEPAVETKVEAPLEAECTGAILLKAADYLVGGSYYIAEAIKNQLPSSTSDLPAKTEALLFSLLNPKLARQDISSYLNELQQVDRLSADIFRIILGLFQEVFCLKATLSDGTGLYLDGQLHTVWSTPNIPYFFSATLYNIKTYINKYFQKNSSIILFMAPGYDAPTKEFFAFLSSLDINENKISSLTLYSPEFEGIETIPLEKVEKRFFIFGLWPWQFAEYRKIKTMGEFKPFYFAPLKMDFYLADIEVEISQPTTNKTLTLKGCALKKDPQGKIKLLILGNLASETVPEDIATLYLNRWPNIEEGLEDFSRKIELFTYAAGSRRFFSTENLFSGANLTQDITAIFGLYLKALDQYVRWYFLPDEYQDQDFSTANERFYALAGWLKKQKKGQLLVTLKTLADYPFLKDLAYACRRINEKEILLSGKERLWLESAF